ncbi:transketolase [Peribacillus psychrosaccharolyticus]|uniref:Transketolase n=1 Tax=Peribacillus psychrosaccharolyticus TaxID=1407 RepID=A0A974NN88_PERPY|nr:transketolase [Peribacillus psychrosaccharolyticus]MEC2056124.1 transketolase [Peribacillus psychrosaccharolyticus]MED3745565.1 transketolase [Peribacillus psychrosaccharolyticus]QQT00683.1 transketolase [Peribacillus psychrosaccharolyticus]
MQVTETNLQFFAKQIRFYTLKELQAVGFGHYGGSLSIVEALAVLYGKHLTIDADDANNPDRDYFVLSKGHGGPALYATLFLKKFFSEETLYTLNQNGTTLPSHPDRNLTPGVEMTTGSLGQGISAAAGIAFGNKLDGRSNYTYAIVGDGELNEGQCWEAIQFAAHHKLDHFVVFIDENKKQLDGLTIDIMNPFDFVEKMKAFGFAAERVDGSNVDAIDEAIQRAKKRSGQPTAIVLDTTKGQGVSYLEEKVDNHHIRPSMDDTNAINAALAELEKALAGGENQ